MNIINEIAKELLNRCFNRPDRHGSTGNGTLTVPIGTYMVGSEPGRPGVCGHVCGQGSRLTPLWPTLYWDRDTTPLHATLPCPVPTTMAASSLLPHPPTPCISVTHHLHITYRPSGNSSVSEWSSFNKSLSLTRVWLNECDIGHRRAACAVRVDPVTHPPTFLTHIFVSSSEYQEYIRAHHSHKRMSEPHSQSNQFVHRHNS
ncbi:hypothetical protein J6590_057742 [Homalodisca vitripennis]|nr:hypothetical protein J6590_057742 [Homalodisca vitripennis]